MRRLLLTILASVWLMSEAGQAQAQAQSQSQAQHLSNEPVPIVAENLVPAVSPVILDNFEDLTPWHAEASTDVTSLVSLAEGPDGSQALRLSYDFNGRSGHAFATRSLPITTPENYEIRFRVRGSGLPNTFEIKLTDATAENAYRRQVTNYEFPDGWTEFIIKKRQIVWAMGPNPDRTFRESQRIEFVVSAGQGGQGWIEVDDLVLLELAPEPAIPPRPIVIASIETENNAAGLAVDGDPATVWRTSAVGDQSLTLDLGYEREFGGLTLSWAQGQSAQAYRFMTSHNGLDWHPLVEVSEGNGGVDWLRTPEASARYLRLELRAPSTRRVTGSGQIGSGQARAMAQTQFGLAELTLMPLSFGETETGFLSAIALQSRRGLYPRGFRGEQPYWTLVGVDGGGESGFISEDGAIELRQGGPSIEPFVLDNGRLVTWADVSISQALVDDDLPIPTVSWVHEGWSLKVTAMAEGDPESASLFGRYDLTNTSRRTQTLTLALAARPMQVNSPVQSLAAPGGASPIRQIRMDRQAMTLNETVKVQSLNDATTFLVSSFEAGADPQNLLARADRRQGAGDTVSGSDPSGLMAGTWIFEMTLQPGETRTLGWTSALSGQGSYVTTGLPVAEALEALSTRIASGWREKLDRFDLIVPSQAQRIEDTMKSSLAHMLMSRQGPSLQPGTHSYNRSWIRDGAMMAEGLNRLGHADLSAAYLAWYAAQVFDNGKVPCCVDARGVDPVPKNDSYGAFVFLAAETYRYTGDQDLLLSVWPQVQGAINHMDELRASTRTSVNRTRENRHLFGLLPASLSHGRYSDKPAWAYWDNFWGLLGYKDAVFIAETLGDRSAVARFSASRDQFSREVRASISGTAVRHRIDWIAGAADRGDFDPTSTTIALSPGGEQINLPQGLLKRTFEKYWEDFTLRQTNSTGWRDYTPHELRNVGALTRLGQRDRAIQALDFFLADRRPANWNGWAEVVGRDLREPRFIGDLPHAWVSSDYIRSALDLFVYERDTDQAIVIADGIPLDWLDTETGVGIRDVRTSYGPFSYLIQRREGNTSLTLTRGVEAPGGYVLRWPQGQPLPTRTRIDGRSAKWDLGELKIPAGARRVEFR